MPIGHEGKGAIAEVLSCDHERLSETWRRCVEGIRACNVDLIRRNFEAFNAGLRHHIKVEEEILFPAFEAASGMSPAAGPTAVMRAEHREIERILDNVATLLAAGDCIGLRKLVEGTQFDPTAFFAGHDAKEETVLYPMADRVIDGEHAGRVVAAMNPRRAEPG